MGNACVDEQIKPLQVISTYKQANSQGSKVNSHSVHPEPAETSQINSKKLEPQQIINNKQPLSSHLDEKSISFSLVSPPKLSQHVAKILRTQIRQRPLADSPHKGIHKPVQFVEDKELFYEGQWMNNQPHGRGTVYYQSGLYFQGYFHQGQIDCNDCILIFPDGSFYRGEMRRGQFQGKGQFNSASGTVYKGDWRQGIPHGTGEQKFPDGNSYEGDFDRGMKHGLGVFRWNDGKVYQGQFSKGKMQGDGKFYKGQEFFAGQFQGNRKVGRGKLKTEFGTYDAQFQNGSIEGPGTFQWLDHTSYEGELSNGVPHGEGTINFADGRVVKGVWQKGQNIKITQVRSRSRSKSKSSVK